VGDGASVSDGGVGKEKGGSDGGGRVDTGVLAEVHVGDLGCMS
jgi:hypothetical protein